MAETCMVCNGKGFVIVKRDDLTYCTHDCPVCQPREGGQRDE